jgi:L-idonate 5-dehydrogenase
MLAGMLHGRQDLRLEEIENPQLTRGYVRLKVLRAGICGSDIHYFSHGRCGAFVPTRPFVLGHEFVATVDAIGSDVGYPVVGDRVVVNPALSCGNCENCLVGRINLCSGVIMLGSASTNPPTNGAFAQYIVVPAQQCFRIPESMDDSVATMMEPLSVALHAFHRAGSVEGARVLISGGGPIGLLTALVARQFGASLIVISEPSRSRRSAAERIVADKALDPSQDFVAETHRFSKGGFDIIFEASGAPAAVEQGVAVLRRGGVFVQIGTVGQNRISLPVNDFMVNENHFLGSFRYTNEFPEAIRLGSTAGFNLKSLISAEFPLAELTQAMSAACDADNAFKVHLVVGAERSTS